MPCLLVAAACGDNHPAPAGGDAGPRADASGPADAAVIPDGAAPLAWVDFAASGCTLGGTPELPTCTGSAPLAITFQAISPSPIDEYRWRFGDQGPMQEPVRDRAPTHVFAAPGSYDVSLTASGPGGSSAASKAGFIVVIPADLGAPCTGDDQCDAGECVCADADCPPSLTQGMCSARCGGTPCDDGVCVSLAPGAGASADWHDDLCVADCAADPNSCPAGTTCQSLRESSGGFARGCFGPGILADIGRSCTDAAGAPDPSRCASDQCMGEGARGMCSASCSTSADCPAEAVCATFGGPLGKRCLARCVDFACDQDPLLACEAPGITADKGFTVDETPSSAGYCAPKRCTSPDQCGTDGACVGNYCTLP